MASLTRQVRLKGARSRPCYAAGVLLCAVLLVASIDSYLWGLRVERAQLVQALRASESERAELSRRVLDLVRDLQAANARGRAAEASCAASSTPGAKSVARTDRLGAVAPVRFDRATRTRADRAPLNRATPQVRP